MVGVVLKTVPYRHQSMENTFFNSARFHKKVGIEGLKLENLQLSAWFCLRNKLIFIESTINFNVLIKTFTSTTQVSEKLKLFEPWSFVGEKLSL